MRHPQEPATPDEPLDEPLVVRLRELKDRTGLSLVALAARTPYSKSAWHRYLTGTQRPPRPAVEALSRLAGTDPAAVLALWEAAEEPPATGRPDQAHQADQVDQADPPDQEAHRGRGWARWLPLPALALLGVAAAVTLPDRGGAPAAQTLSTAPRCHGRSCQGQLPDASVCARDAQTRSSVTGRSYAVLLRYSPACGTAWSEVRTRSPRRREVSVRAGQDVLSAGYPADDSTRNASPMLAVGSPRGVEACAEMDGQLACTGLDVEADDPG
ncbi:XRE family transcriptional regulator [Streptomyces sp. NPDC048297]|uniref:XRE family transcriptional regulator n=1 Tax=Streptomyces sp. NPDC048297 TaxID=3365531 RepID=UPI0037160DA0